MSSTNSTTSIYCYFCKRTFNVEKSADQLQSLECPSCHQGFVEFIENHDEIPVVTNENPGHLQDYDNLHLGMISTLPNESQTSQIAGMEAPLDPDKNTPLTEEKSGRKCSSYKNRKIRKNHIHKRHGCPQKSRSRYQKKTQTVKKSQNPTVHEEAKSPRVGLELPIHPDTPIIGLTNASLSSILIPFISSTHNVNESSPSHFLDLNSDIPLVHEDSSNMDEMFFSSLREFSNMAHIASLPDLYKHSVSQETLKKLPVIKVEHKHCKKGCNDELDCPTCSICCNSIKLGDTAQLLPCNHMFHPDCIKPWFNENNTCPICRLEIRTEQPLSKL